MLAALRGRWVQFAIFMGVSERYPQWFIEEIANRVFVNESRFCFWTSPPERECDYYEKELIETYSVVVRKYDGSTHVMSMDVFHDLYNVFKYEQSVNGGIAAFAEDCIEYVECFGGKMLDHYPKWFYEYFTESLNYPDDEESYLFSLDNNGCIVIDAHCVFLRNKFGEIKQTLYTEFIKYYDPMLSNECWWEEYPF
jgi:hypothetical protein